VLILKTEMKHYLPRTIFGCMRRPACIMGSKPLIKIAGNAEVHPIGQEYVGKGALVLVVGLSLLRTVNAAEADTFKVLVVQDFEYPSLDPY
jgi:hypothetical protein